MSYKTKPLKPMTGDDSSRTAILNAALDVFSREGAAGARTEEIARVAGVNKALLYYYFKDKDALLGAVLEQVMGQAMPRLMAAMDAAVTPREQLLAYINLHFDSIAAKPHISRLIQYEILRAAEGGGGHMPLIAERFNRPLSLRIEQILQQGMDSGEFIAGNARQVMLSVLGLIVFYFMTAPVFHLVTGIDPYAPARLAERKSAVIDFVSHALFVSSLEPSGRAKMKKKKKQKGKKKKGKPGERKK